MGLREDFKKGYQQQRDRQQGIAQDGKPAVREPEPEGERPAKEREREEKRAAKEREREERKAAADRIVEQKQKEREQRAFEESPPGRARTVHATGQRYFQIMLPIEGVDRSWWAKATHDMSSASIRVSDTSDHVGATLTAVEDEGWKLITAGFTFRQTAEASRDKFLASGQQTTITGQTLGVYLFARS